MITLKSKIIAGFTALILLFGAFYIVEAMEKKEEVKVEKKESINFTVTAWYVVDSSNPSNPKVIGSPIAAPPVNDDEGCAQENPPTDKLCAVQLNVPNATHSFTTPTDLSALPSGITQTGNEARSPEN